jgi:hypothetical protein
MLGRKSMLAVNFLLDLGPVGLADIAAIESCVKGYQAGSRVWEISSRFANTNTEPPPIRRNRIFESLVAVDRIAVQVQKKIEQIRS